MTVIVTVAVIVAAAAIVLQAILLFALYRQARSISEQVSVLAPKAESLMESAQRTLEQSRKQFTEVSTKANDVLDTAKSQLVRINDVLEDAATRARVQLDRVELVLDDTISRVHQTIALVHDGFLRPIKEITGIAAGVRAAIGHLFGGRRPSVAQATHDDEMFI